MFSGVSHDSKRCLENDLGIFKRFQKRFQASMMTLNDSSMRMKINVGIFDANENQRFQRVWKETSIDEKKNDRQKTTTIDDEKQRYSRYSRFPESFREKQRFPESLFLNVIHVWRWQETTFFPNSGDKCSS